MTVDRVTLLLLEMRGAANDALGYVEDRSRTDYLQNTMMQKAVAMCFIQIGEAAANLMRAHPDFVAATPQLEWQKMRGMRNVVAHGYDKLDPADIWEIVGASLPELLEQLAVIIPQRDFDGVDVDA